MPPFEVQFLCSDQAYYVSKQALVQSAYLGRVLSSPLAEVTHNRIVLSWTKSYEIAFRSVIEFLYTGDYSVEHVHWTEVKDAQGGSQSNRITRQRGRDAYHVNIYVLANRLQISKLMSLALTKYSSSPFEPECICLQTLGSLVAALYGDTIDMSPDAMDKDLPPIPPEDKSQEGPTYLDHIWKKAQTSPKVAMESDDAGSPRTTFGIDEDLPSSINVSKDNVGKAELEENAPDRAAEQQMIEEEREKDSDPRRPMQIAFAEKINSDSTRIADRWELIDCMVEYPIFEDDVLKLDAGRKLKT